MGHLPFSCTILGVRLLKTMDVLLPTNLACNAHWRRPTKDTKDQRTRDQAEATQQVEANEDRVWATGCAKFGSVKGLPVEKFTLPISVDFKSIGVY